jgi:hypothetical protein
VFTHPAGYSTHVFLLCLGGVLLTYTHNLFCASEAYPTGCVFVVGGVGGRAGVIIVACYTGLIYYRVVGCIVLSYLRVFSYLSTVCDICLSVLFYILSAAYYVSCDNLVKAIPDYGVVSLAVAGLFYTFLMASRAF